MVERLICEHCDEFKLPVYGEETKAEETMCCYCSIASQHQAECLFKGKPCCISCKVNQKGQTKSPAGSIRSDRLDSGPSSRPLKVLEKKSSRTGASFDEISSPFRSPTSMAGAHEYATKIESTLARAFHSRSSSQVATEFLKANAFLQRYVNNSFKDLMPLYDSQTDGFSSEVFHSKCDDSKGGIILIISLGSGYEVAAFSWKGIRKGCPESSDVQVGGAIIKNTVYEFVTFSDQFVINEPEGIRFSRSTELYVNFDKVEQSICNFDKKLKNNPTWTSWIQEIAVYKLHV